MGFVSRLELGEGFSITDDWREKIPEVLHGAESGRRNCTVNGRGGFKGIGGSGTLQLMALNV